MEKTSRSKAERLEAVNDKVARLTAEAARLKRLISQEDRKRDMQRKIIVGAAVLAHANFDAAFASGLSAALAKAVTRERDREIIADLLPGQK